MYRVSGLCSFFHSLRTSHANWLNGTFARNTSMLRVLLRFRQRRFNALAVADLLSSSLVHAGPIAPNNRLQLLDSYVGVNLGNWQLTLGKQSLSWTPGPEGSLL
jgi:hypothetical protein